MLKEIRCEKFRTKRIEFHKGLNAVLGDEIASNSIGKSILLMVVDFIFGGNSFLKQNEDVVNELGHHIYQFNFEFENEKYFFCRSTNTPDLIYTCDEDYNEVKPLSLEEYRAYLKKMYRIENKNLTFRGLIGTYSRIWGKDNLEVRKPLHVVQNKRAEDCINLLLKVFNKYDKIDTIISDLKKQTEQESSYKKAQSHKIISRIGKRQYIENQHRINEMQAEIRDIKDKLSLFATNISEITNKSTLELKKEKDKLLEIKIKLQSKLNRVERNLKGNKYIKSKNLRSIQNIIPSINMDKLEEIELFHNELSKILKNELIETKENLILNIEQVDIELEIINNKISETLQNVSNPIYIVDRVYELSMLLQKYKTENNYYENLQELTEEVKELKKYLVEEKLNALKNVQDLINHKIFLLVEEIYNKERKAPEISLSPNKYSYEIYEDTGTGKAYSNLLVFDLAIIQLTDLPIVIHDSLLFKNIENMAVTHLVNTYLNLKKQSFISLDEINKYGVKTVEALDKAKVISLDDENLLFIKDWRNKSRSSSSV